MVEDSVPWDSCAAAGCIGVNLPGGSQCWAHAGQQEVDAALKRLGADGCLDMRGVPVIEELLRRVLAAAPRNERGCIVLAAAMFDRAVFRGDAVFNEAIFHSDVSFDGATFGRNAQFVRATFHRRAGFVGATFGGEANFDGAIFRDTAIFERAAFRAVVTFGGAVFSSNAWFNGATFGGATGFANAIFRDTAIFGRATFGGAAGFHQAIFHSNAGFDQAVFRAVASFDGTTFGRKAWFGGTTFGGDAHFVGATFSGDAHFSNVALGGTTFGGDAVFRGVTFRRGAVFRGGIFEEAREIGPLLACRGLDLDGVRFAQPVRIEVSTSGLCCRRAMFSGGVQFWLRWARVVLDDTDFSSASIVASIPRLTDAQLERKEQHIARAWLRLLTGKISERPTLLSLRRADLARLGFRGVDLSDCRFAGAHNLDKLSVEADVTLTTAPARLGQDRRQVIAEERAWRARRSSHWTAPQWPKWAGEEPAVLEAGQIAGLYRALRKGREDNRDEPGAADFYYGEMEMRRQARTLPASSESTGFTGGTARGRAERGILTVYWAVSGYGLRALRALAWLAVVIAGFATAFHLTGFATPPRPSSYWTSLLYAFRATLSLTDDDVKLTAWGKLLQGLLRVTGPVLLGLALLALRNRVKR